MIAMSENNNLDIYFNYNNLKFSAKKVNLGRCVASLKSNIHVIDLKVPSNSTLVKISE